MRLEELLIDDQDWQIARSADTMEAMESYPAKHLKGKHAGEANRRRQELQQSAGRIGRRFTACIIGE
jgi:hypothetical protein